MLNLQSQDACYRSQQNTQPIDHPINGELLACLAETGSSKNKRTNNSEKGGLDRVERLKNTVRNQETHSEGEGKKKIEARDKREMRELSGASSSHTNQ